MIILDASALYPLAKRSRHAWAEVAERLLAEEAAVLDLTLYEAANAALMEARRNIIHDPHRLIAAIARLAENLALIRVSPGDLEAVGRLAAELGLTVYDAAYVYYSRLHEARLVTGDKELLAKAGDGALSIDEWLT